MLLRGTKSSPTMGFIILKPQLQAIQELTALHQIDSLELLWLPGGIQVVVWMKYGQTTQFLVDEDGQIA